MFISLLPADTYTVVKKSIITEQDRQNIISLYEPIIGPLAVSLYYTLLRDIRLMDYISKTDYNHHHLMKTMKLTLDNIKLARASLEGVGLLKTYYKEGEPNSYVYELYAPLSPKEFFASPIFNITLYNNIGKTEYELLLAEFDLPKLDLKSYQDISSSLNQVYMTSATPEPIDAWEHTSLSVKLESNIDFDFLMASMPKGLLKTNVLTKKMKELIEQLAFIYNLDTLKMVEILRSVITEKGTFDKESLRKNTRKYYQYNNNGRLPTLVYRTQPEYLKSPKGDTSPLAQIIYMFENTNPYDFLKIKYKGGKPTTRDLNIIEYLWVDVGLQPGVINVLIDYALKKNNNKLNKNYIETIAGQWKRCNIETVKEAMDLARSENNKYTKVNAKNSKTTKNTENKKPVWFDENISKEEINEEQRKELEELLKDFR